MFGVTIICLLFEGISSMLKLLSSIEHYRFIYYHWIIIIVHNKSRFCRQGHGLVSFAIFEIYGVGLNINY